MVLSLGPEAGDLGSLSFHFWGQEALPLTLRGSATQGNVLLDLQRPLTAEEPGTFLRQDGDSMWLVWGQGT